MNELIEIRDQLAEDYERTGLDSVLVGWCFDRRAESFRVKAKRLTREASRDAGRRLPLVRYLLDELQDGGRLRGKGERIEGMADNPALEVLTSLGRRGAADPTRAMGAGARRRTAGVRAALVSARESLVGNPAAVEDLDWFDLEGLVCAMLAADHERSKRNSLEVALEQCEDVLWPEERAPWMGEGADARSILMGDDFASLFEKLSAKDRDRAVEDVRTCALRGDAPGTYAALRVLARVDADQELLNLGFRKMRDGADEMPAEGHLRKKTIDSDLLMRFLSRLAGSQTFRDGSTDTSQAWTDLRRLYLATCGDAACRRLMVPLTIDEGTGVGVYLMGVDRLGVYVQGPRCEDRNVTVALIDHRLAEPFGEGRYSISDWPVVMFRPKVLLLETMPGATRGMRGHPQEKWLRARLEELRSRYGEWKGIALRESFRQAQRVSAPEGCPDRFLAYFG